MGGLTLRARAVSKATEAPIDPADLAAPFRAG